MEVDPQVLSIFKDFLSKYQPADNWTDAEEHYTTAEVQNHFETFFTSAYISALDIYNYLIELGFKHDKEPKTMRTCWLFKYK